MYGKSPWKWNGHSVEQRVQIIKFYYQNHSAPFEKCSAHYVIFYPRHNRPAESTIRCLVVKFDSTASINNLLCVRVYGKTRGGQFLVVHKNLTFLRLQLGILHRDLGLHPYKIQLIQKFKVNDDKQRRVFADWVLEQLEVNPIFRQTNHL